MIHLRQSTAATVVVGVLVDDTDFKTAETVAFDAAGIDVNLIKGATKGDRTLRVDAGDGYWAHLEDGYHALTLGEGDTDTLGRLRVTFTATGVLPAWEDFMVMPAVAWDALYAASGGALLVNAVQISGDATAADNAELMFDGTGYAGGAIKLGVDTVAISGDATAADNAELMFDGTGYAGGSIKLGVDAVAISGDATAADNAELMFDGTGYAGGTTKLVVGEAASVAGNVGGNVTGSVGSVASYGTLVADTAAAVWATVTKTVTSCSGSVASVAGNVTGSVGSVASYGTLVADVAAAVWATAIKTVTSCSGAVASVTGAVGSVASYGTLVADTAAAVWASVARTLTSYGTLVADIVASGMGISLVTLSESTTTITITESGEVLSGNGDIALTRDDTRVLAFAATGHDWTGYSIYLTVRPTLDSASTADTDAIFQVAGVIPTPNTGSFTVTIAKAQTDLCTLNTRYWYDVQARSSGGVITTLIKARLTVTGDVTRRITA